MIKILWEKTFDFLVSTCGKYVVDTWRQRSCIESHLDTLQVTLPKAHGLIMRSECWRIPKYESIDKLLPLLKDAAYEAEAVADEVEYQCAKQNVQKDGQGEFLSDYFKNWMRGFPQKVKKVQENLYNLCKKMEDECNRLEIPENHNQFSKTARPITTKYGGAVFCGRDKELNDVIRLLGVYKCGSKLDSRKRKRNHSMSSMAIGESSSGTEKHKNVSILSIVGLGGVGKTTLAQMVYNDRSVQRYFEILIWICISENFDVRRLTKEIIECVTKRACNHTNLNILQETLEQALKEKRFLLVMDDAWSESEIAWQQLLGPMKGGLQGSAILLTTRTEKVVAVASKGMESIGSIYLEGLEENIYWEFFKSCAFGLQESTENYPGLEAIGKQICKKLRGSPLAAKTIGGLLKINLDEGHWTNIRDSKIWQLKQEEHHILPVLQLSYQYLPSHLKKCFSFCSLYPKDFKFTKTTLAKFWIKHGLISSPKNPLHLQDILAEVYFDELIGRCFFQRAAESVSDAYVIHDLMHDVCQFITKDECFCIEDDTFEEKVSPDIRHLSVFQRKLINLDKQNELIKYKKLLSLSIDFSMGPQATRIEYWFNNLTTIRSLSLVNCINLELPESIGNLKHLQYLDISFTMNIPKLPHALCSLYSLKYLNMEGSLCSCSFPKGSDKLVSLQVFYFPRAGMPLDDSVMDLAKAIVAKDQKLFLTNHGSITNVKIQNLKHISIRGSLTIHNLEFVLTKEAAEEAELNKKSLIDRLDLWWSKGHEHDDEEVLEGLCPHPNLRELELHYYRGRNLSQSWLKEEFLPNLTEISIWHCESDFIISHLPRCITKLRIMHCSQLTSLENLLVPVCLPVLNHLEVMNCEKLVSLPVQTFGGFSLLNQLRICGCPELTSCPNAMVLPPSLKHLHLSSCGDIEKSIAGCLQSLTSLEKLILRTCPNLVSIPHEVASSLESLTLLEVHDCAELQLLGGLQFRASLHKVNIVRCPKLKETRAQYLTMQSEQQGNLPSSS